ncbi:MAG: anti-sigma factor [Edaphobacter sp.]
MADFNQFGSAQPPQSGDAHHCTQCEAMLADALDGTLSASDQAAFDLHMASCASCSSMLADAQRGLAWMELLKSSRPEPPAALLDRIFAQTCNEAAGESSHAPVRLREPNTLPGRPPLVPSYAPAIQPSAAFVTTNVPFRTRMAYGLRSIGHTMLQPRLAMTAAMAFFSIALTMNLTGVHLSNLRASDLKPSSILRTAYDAKARVVRYSDNLRVVYELESRVRDLQRSSDSDYPTSTPAPQNAPSTATPGKSPSGDRQLDDQKPGTQNPDQKQTRPKPGPGSSRRDTPGGHLLLVGSAQRRGSQLASMQPFVVFSPRAFHRTEKGGLV